MRRIAILGSTGSIGTQALDVISRYPDKWTVEAVAAYSNTDLLFEQVKRFRPRFAALVKEPEIIPDDLKAACDWFFGDTAIISLIRACEADDILVSVVGFAGLDAVIESLVQNKRVLLANKEPLVAAGNLVMSMAKKKNIAILPIDSEHSAIFQCLQGAAGNKPSQIILTASGGPFLRWTKEAIEKASKKDALHHPNWSMGSKISIDSASMMNKALEVIEARWLFDMPVERISVVVHPQSIVHSMVEFDDGAVIAQMGTPDMRLPILYAMSYPKRLATGGKSINFAEPLNLTFEKPDMQRFPALKLGYDALREGGTMPAVMNGANEIAVDAFLKDRIYFGDISRLVEKTMNAIPVVHNPGLEEVYEADRRARQKASEFLSTGSFR